MFIDEATIKIKAGKGGNGIIAFRREKHVPKGGPAGGDGGDGGSVYFMADEGMTTLQDLKFQKHVRAENGEDGKPKNMHGKNGEDTILAVPIGTIVYEQETNEVIADLTEHDQKVLIAEGGKGGRGNKAFATSRNKAPRIQENGKPGESLMIRVELKLLADVGIIGFPSVGKSTFIRTVTDARPKVADYHFTTLIPNLGVVNMQGVESFVLADMPGLIEGASKGTGLGIQFLKHIERTRVLLHMLDMSEINPRDPYKDYVTINDELKSYRYDLQKRPQIVVANKMDAPGAQNRLEDFKQKIDDDVIVIPISTITKDNVPYLLQKTKEMLDKTDPFPIYDAMDVGGHMRYVHDEGMDFIIKKENEGIFRVTGDIAESMASKHNLNSPEAMSRFLKALKNKGLDDKLRDAGASDGDTIILNNQEFEFIE